MDLTDKRSDETFSATILGEWSAWGPCSRPCARGLHYRYFRHGRQGPQHTSLATS